MVIAMHPDDDVLFLGAIVPIYGAEGGRNGTIVYATLSSRPRREEAINGAWTMGLRIAPQFGPFQDISKEEPDTNASRFNSNRLIRYLVRVLRTYRPEVVFSHDLNGEYGHWQHKRLARAVFATVPLAADESFDPESTAAYGVWRVKKLYLHLYPEQQIVLDVDQPLSAFGGKTAVDVSKEAYLRHASQLSTKHAVRNTGVYSLADFGLAYSIVGADTPGVNDPFEHVSKQELCRMLIEETMSDAIANGIRRYGMHLIGGIPKP
mgnify:CR=1 FL=1